MFSEQGLQITRVSLSLSLSLLFFPFMSHVITCFTVAKTRSSSLSPTAVLSLLPAVPSPVPEASSLWKKNINFEDCYSDFRVSSFWKGWWFGWNMTSDGLPEACFSFFFIEVGSATNWSRVVSCVIMFERMKETRNRVWVLLLCE